MVNVGHNYGNKTSCKICNLEEDDSQEHIFDCIVLKIKCPELFNMTDEKYDDIFSQNVQKLIKVAKVCESAIKLREILLFKYRTRSENG